MALLLTESVESFAITILDMLIDFEFLRLTALYNYAFFDCFSFHAYTNFHSSFYSRLTSSS